MHIEQQIEELREVVYEKNGKPTEAKYYGLCQGTADNAWIKMVAHAAEAPACHPPVQEDWLGTKDEIGNSNVHLDSSNLHLDLVPQELILVTAPKLQEDWVRYKDIGYCSIKSMSLLKHWCHKMSRHQNCKRCPSTSLYEFRFV